MAKTKKKPKMRVTSFIRECPRFLKLALQGARNETLPAPEGEKGTLEHGLLEDLLNNVNKTYLEKYREPTPLLELLQRKDLIRFETEKEVIIDEEDLPIILVGHLDHYFRFPEKHIITDMKTGYWASPDDPAYRLQTELYSYIFLRDTDKPVETYLFKPQYAEMPRMEVLDPMAEIRIKAYMKKKMNFILSLKNEKNPKTKSGVDCKYCPYSISCPADPYVDIKKDPDSYIAEFVKIDAKHSQMFKIVKDYTKTIDGLKVVNGKEIGWEIGNKTTWDNKGIVEFLVKHLYKGKDKKKVLEFIQSKFLPLWGNPNAKAMEGLIKQAPEMENFKHFEPEPKFRNRKAKPKKANKEE